MFFPVHCGIALISQLSSPGLTWVPKKSNNWSIINGCTKQGNRSRILVNTRVNYREWAHVPVQLLEVVLLSFISPKWLHAERHFKMHKAFGKTLCTYAKLLSETRIILEIQWRHMELCAGWFKFTSQPQCSWAFLCTDGMNLWYFHIESHTRHLNVYMTNKISAQRLHPALIFPSKFNPHCERKQVICSLASGHVVVLEVILLSSWGCGGDDLLASNHTPATRDTHPKASHILDFPCAILVPALCTHMHLCSLSMGMYSAISSSLSTQVTITPSSQRGTDGVYKCTEAGRWSSTASLFL